MSEMPTGASAMICKAVPRDLAWQNVSVTVHLFVHLSTIPDSIMGGGSLVPWPRTLYYHHRFELLCACPVLPTDVPDC